MSQLRTDKIANKIDDLKEHLTIIRRGIIFGLVFLQKLEAHIRRVESLRPIWMNTQFFIYIYMQRVATYLETKQNPIYLCQKKDACCQGLVSGQDP